MNMKAHLSDEKIQDIASESARNVCESGSPNAAQHNAATIAVAIRNALEQATVVTITRKQEGGK